VIEIFCDGFCTPRGAGDGGYGFVVFHNGWVTEGGGTVREVATVNRMEMVAALEALRSVRHLRGPVVIYSDSKFLRQGMKTWICKWKERGWRTIGGDPVKNRDVWEALSEEVYRRATRVEWKWVKGHSGIEGNERADALAKSFRVDGKAELYSGPGSLHPRCTEKLRSVVEHKR
jgi:ribonuclease HI